MEHPKAKASVPAPVHRAGSVVVVGLLAALGAWSIAVPYVAPALGLNLEVRPGVEVIDHVVPGLAVVVAGAALVLILRNRRESLLVAALIGVVFLAGFWMLSTHVPLLVQAGRDLAPWAASIFHTAPGAAIAIVALWLLIVELRDGQTG